MSVIAHSAGVPIGGAPAPVADLLVEHPRVGEEEGGLEPEEEDAGQLGLGARGCCATRRAGDPAEQLVVRPPAAEEQQDRQDDGDEDPLEDAEEDYAGSRPATARARWVAARAAAQRLQVDEAEGGDDYDRASALSAATSAPC